MRGNGTVARANRLSLTCMHIRYFWCPVARTCVHCFSLGCEKGNYMEDEVDQILAFGQWTVNLARRAFRQIPSCFYEDCNLWLGDWKNLPHELSLSLSHIYIKKISSHVIFINIYINFKSHLRFSIYDSYSQSLKVPISQRALLKLVTWFYMGELPKLEFHCRWNYMSSEEQFLELIIYLELSWLAESWCLDDVHQECTELVVSCIETTPSFPLEIIKSASTFGCHAIVGAAISRLGPLYPQLRDSGELDSLDEALVDLLRSEYVHCSQKDWEKLLWVQNFPSPVNAHLSIYLSNKANIMQHVLGL